MIRVPSGPIPPSFGSLRTGSFSNYFNSQIPTRLYFLRQQSVKTMLGYSRFLTSFCNVRKGSRKLLPFWSFSQHRLNSTLVEDPKLHDFLDFMEQLKNYERIGVPKDAGTDSDDGFDLGRMRRLLQGLGNPHSRFKAVHVAGTKGKGSTAAFLSNILREEGYFVGCYTSPHLLTIRERIALGRSGDPVSVELLRNLFYHVRGILDRSIEMEGGALTHFEVIIGGPLQPHIEHIIRNKASSVNSPVVSACDAGIKSITRFFGREEETPYQCCEIHINIKDDMPLFIDLPDVKLRMLGKHQLQNAVTATCAALCLRNEGWKISDESIQAGLEKTCLPGRGQYLTKKEAETLGLSGVAVLVDGAHTEASAKGLTELIKMENPDGLLALVVSMASDKDHMAFAMQFLTGRRPDVVILNESNIAGSRSRTASSSNLKDVWFRAANNMGISALDLGTINQWKISNNDSQVMLIALPNALVGDSMQIAAELLRSKSVEKPLLIVVTGSLHIVSSVLLAVS